MNNPLKIMDEIEHDTMNRGCSTISATKRQYQSLRSAIKEQQAQIALLRQGLEKFASGSCCQTEGCTPEEPCCDVNFAKQILNDSNTQSASALFEMEVLQDVREKIQKELNDPSNWSSTPQRKYDTKADDYDFRMGYEEASDDLYTWIQDKRDAN